MLHFYALLAVVLLAVSDAFRATSSIRASERIMNMRFSVGVVGATGAVGEEILKVLM